MNLLLESFTSLFEIPCSLFDIQIILYRFFISEVSG
jgi:hypothetical protein